MIFLPFPFLEGFHKNFLFNHHYWAITSFLKFALLSTIGEVIGLRLTTKSYFKEGHLVIDVIDEGKGIDESKDLFAPFLRTQDSDGVGLGLFLVKSAADAMNAEVELFNRIDHQGTVARVTLPKYTSCKI